MIKHLIVYVILTFWKINFSFVTIAYYCSSSCFVLWSDCPFEHSGIFATLTSWTLRGSPSSLLPNTGVHLPVGPGQGRNTYQYILSVLYVGKDICKILLDSYIS